MQDFNAINHIYIDGPYTATIYVGEFFFEFSTYKLIFHTASREPMSNSAVLNIRTDINQSSLFNIKREQSVTKDDYLLHGNNVFDL